MYQEITIQLIESCNLTCPYCFAQKSSTGKLSKPNFEKFLRFCKENKPDCIHITGGEPMFHEKFCEIINLLSEISPLVVYSNFTKKDGLKDINLSAFSRIYFLVNFNQRQLYTDNEWNYLHENIQMAIHSRAKVALSYTFYDKIDFLNIQFEYLIYYMCKYGLSHLRISQALACQNQKIGLKKKTLILYIILLLKILKSGNKRA